MAIFLLPEKSVAQCDLKFEYKVEEDKLLLKSDTSLSTLVIELYDLRRQLVIRKSDISSSSNNWSTIFDNIGSSTYVIVIKYGNCEKILGGLGININSNN